MENKNKIHAQIRFNQKRNLPTPEKGRSTKSNKNNHQDTNGKDFNNECIDDSICEDLVKSTDKHLTFWYLGYLNHNL